MESRTMSGSEMAEFLVSSYKNGSHEIIETLFVSSLNLELRWTMQRIM